MLYLQLTPGLRELCGSFWFLSGAREQLLFLALWFFLLELSEQCAFCILANNKGTFWLTSGQLASTSTGSNCGSGGLSLCMQHCMHQYWGLRVCQFELHGPWTSDRLLPKLIAPSTTLEGFFAWGNMACGLGLKVELWEQMSKSNDTLWGSAACWEVP